MPHLRERALGIFGLKESLVFSLLLLSITIHRIESQADFISSASGYTCDPACRPGHECKFGICQRVACNQNCTDVPKGQPFCGSNGKTYHSLCEKEKTECELTHVINKEYDGPCLTIPPPPEPVCRDHQLSFNGRSLEEFNAKCRNDEVTQKYTAGTLELSDVVECYYPQCDGRRQYLRKQCGSPMFREWCWCSSVEGVPINDSFQMNMPTGYCTNERSCVVDGATRMHGEVYTPENFCGLCECKNGVNSCFVNHTLDEDNQLSNTSLKKLKDDLIQVYNFQFNHKGHIKIDIRTVYNHPTIVTDTDKRILLSWKFNHYDKTQDGILYVTEMWHFRNEIGTWFGCNKFFKQITELVDSNNNREVTLEEMHDFFDLQSSSENSGQPVRREAIVPAVPHRKPLHLRKKFHYVLQ